MLNIMKNILVYSNIIRAKWINTDILGVGKMSFFIIVTHGIYFKIRKTRVPPFISFINGLLF